MKATLKIKIGSKSLEITGEGDNKQVIKNFSFWSQLPDKCGLCKSNNMALNYRSPKGNDYYGLKCLDCGADLNFGQYKQGGGFFLRSDEGWKVWNGMQHADTDEKRHDERREEKVDESSF